MSLPIERVRLAVVFPVLFLYALHVLGISAWSSPADFENRVQSAIREAYPAIVSITTADGSTYGSGFIIDKDRGLILTSYHVVAKKKQFTLKLASDTEHASAEVMRLDQKVDLAILRAKNHKPFEQELEISSEPLALGQFVIAIGSPGGYDFSVSLGVTSAVERKLSDVNLKTSFIQVDASMAKGSSGGPLINLDGKVVGLNSRGGASGSAAFAVPSATILRFIQSEE